MKKFMIAWVILLVTSFAWGDWTITYPSATQMKATQTFTASGTTFSASNFIVTSEHEGYWLSHVKLVPGTGPTDDCDIDTTLLCFQTLCIIQHRRNLFLY